MFTCLCHMISPCILSHNHLTRHFDTSPLGWKQPVQPAIFPTFVGKALTLLVAVPMYLVYSEIPIVVSFNSILFFSSQILVIHLDFAVSPVCWLDCFLFEAWSAAMDFGIKKLSSNPFFTGWIPYSPFQIYCFSFQIPEFVAEKRRFLAPEVVKNDSDRCWDVLKHMEKRGCHPNNVTCSSDKNLPFQWLVRYNINSYIGIYRVF